MRHQKIETILNQFSTWIQVLKLRLSKVRRERNLSTYSPEQNSSSATQNGWFLREIVQHNLRTGGKRRGEEHLNVWLFFVIGHKTNGNIHLHTDWFLTKSSIKVITKQLVARIFSPHKICAKYARRYGRQYQMEKLIAIVEFIDWWSKMSIAVIEIIDWWLKTSITMVEIIDCWLRIMFAMVQKTIEYHARLTIATVEKRLIDPERLLLSRMERPCYKRGIVHVF